MGKLTLKEKVSAFEEGFMLKLYELSDEYKLKGGNKKLEKILNGELRNIKASMRRIIKAL